MTFWGIINYCFQYSLASVLVPVVHPVAACGSGHPMFEFMMCRLLPIICFYLAGWGFWHQACSCMACKRRCASFHSTGLKTQNAYQRCTSCCFQASSMRLLPTMALVLCTCSAVIIAACILWLTVSDSVQQVLASVVNTLFSIAVTLVSIWLWTHWGPFAQKSGADRATSQSKTDSDSSDDPEPNDVWIKVPNQISSEPDPSEPPPEQIPKVPGPRPPSAASPEPDPSEPPPEQISSSFYSRYGFITRKALQKERLHPRSHCGTSLCGTVVPHFSLPSGAQDPKWLTFPVLSLSEMEEHRKLDLLCRHRGCINFWRKQMKISLVTRDSK